MKKKIIGALVGALILFIWQFLSWSVTGLHNSQMAYTENQDAILETLAENLEEGSYFLPTLPKDATAEEAAQYTKDRTGKPWATISYHEEMSNNMPVNMIRGFVVNFLAVFLLCWILLQFSNLTLRNALLTSLAVGFIGYLTVNYINSIWFEGNTIPDLIDVIVGWGATGLWLGWWLRR